MEKADFGLKRERRILESRVRNIFTPHTPIKSVKFFFGRQKEVRKLIEHINTPGQHALLYGDRGVGKSSLANIVSILLKELMGGKLYKVSCDSSDNFVTIMKKPLKAVGYDLNVIATEKKKKSGGKAGLKAGFASASIGGDRETKDIIDGVLNKANSPSWVSEKIYNKNALLVIDEVDSIRNSDDKKKLAELIKQLSDKNSKFKILIVGIAETANSLTAGHKSVHRCLKETKLERMNDDELRIIIGKGAKKLRLIFEYPVISSIINMSAGYPHFTHLLSLKCAEEAITKPTSVVKLDTLEKALDSASEDAEETLKRQYNIAVRSNVTDMYKRIVIAATFCENHDFKASEIRQKLGKKFQISITPKNFGNYMRRLASNDESVIFKRVSKGVYRFSDPRMRSYVRIAESKESNGIVK